MRKRWIVLVLVALSLVVLVPIGVGSVLPEDHTATSYVDLGLPADTVWSLVRDFQAYSSWWPDVRRSERLPDHEGREAWKHVQTSGELPLVIIEENSPSRLVTRILDEGMPFGGTWTYELAETEAGTRVTITENGSVYNPLFRFMSRFLMGHHGTMDRYLESLGAARGLSVVPVHLEG
ncbi:MAG: SRPBCC family protein [Gemmatimonadota bacterium]